MSLCNVTYLWGKGKDALPDFVELGGPKDTHMPVGPSSKAHLLVAAWEGRKRSF